MNLKTKVKVKDVPEQGQARDIFGSMLSLRISNKCGGRIMGFDVKVGLGPDFKLMRGRQLLTYRATVVIMSENSEIERRSLTNFSLGTICKEITFIVRTRSEAKEAKFRFECGTSLKVEFYSCGCPLVVMADLVLPEGISIQQVDDIKSYIENKWSTL